MAITDNNRIDAMNDVKEFIRKHPFRDGAILINVPLVQLDRIDAQVATNKGYFAYPPTTQLYISAVFRDAGMSSLIVDLNYVLLKEAQSANPDYLGAWQNALINALNTFEAPIVGVSLMFESTTDNFDKICRFVRSIKPDVCIAAGGVAATADPGRLLHNHMVDIVFLHEADRTLSEFLAFSNGKSDDVSNVVFLRDDKSECHLNGPSNAPVDIDIRSEYAKINIADYCNVGSLSSLSRMNGRDVPFATLLSRRGCRARCAFCGVRNFNGTGVRIRAAESVVEEMKFLRDTYGIRHFDWLDDDLLYNETDVTHLFNRIAEVLPDITWVANNGLIASAITPGIMEAMRASGCIAYRVGLESGSPEVLRRVHKPTNLAKFYEFCDVAKNYPEMLATVNFIVGFPSETIAQMQASFVCAVRGALDWNNFYVYQHLKNTELYLADSASSAALKTDYSKEGQTPLSHLRDINPVRAGRFNDMNVTGDLLHGYDVFDLPDDVSPDSEQLKEIWFTYTIVANYLMSPSLRTHSEIRLRNNIRWVISIQQAYPNDAAMAALLYFLERRLDLRPHNEIEALRTDARTKLDASAYWQARDRTFHFSAMLDGVVPEIDTRCASILHNAGYNA